MKKEDIIFINSEISTNYSFNNVLSKFITISDNSIMLNKNKEKEPNTLIGSYNIVNFNVRLGDKLGVNVFSAIDGDMELYLTFKNLINANIKDINLRYDNILFVNNLILREDFRNKDIFPEYIKHIYRTYYTDRTLVVFLVKPIQMFRTTFFMYRTMKKVALRTKFDTPDIIEVSMEEYYKLGSLVNKYDDLEMQTYKLYNKAKECGLNMFANYEGLFYISEKNVLKLFDDGKI